MASNSQESMTRIFRGVGFYNTGNDYYDQTAPGIVDSGILADYSNVYDEGGYVESCDLCPNSISCPHCPQFRVTDTGAATSTMAGIAGVAPIVDTNTVYGAEYMCVRGSADKSGGQGGPRTGCVNGNVMLGQGDGRFSQECVDEAFYGASGGPSEGFYGAGVPGDMVGSPSTLSDMSMLDGTTSGGTEGYCAGGYKCMDLAPNGPHNDAAHIRNWHDTRPECHSAVTPGYHYVPPPGMFGYRHDPFSDVSAESDCRLYKTRTDEILYRDIMQLDADSEPASEECEIFGINGYVYKQPCDMKAVMQEQARQMSQRDSTWRN
jgi:hypothetical protein